MRRLALPALLLAAACGRAVPAADPAVADTIPTRFTRTLAGDFGGRPVRLELRREDDQISGWVEGEELWLSGAIDSTGTVRLEESDDEGPTATIEGRLVFEPGAARLEGVRTPAEGPPAPVALVEAVPTLPGGARIVSVDVEESDPDAHIEIYVVVPRIVGPDGEPTADPALHPLAAAIDAVVREELAHFRTMFSLGEPDPADSAAGGFLEEFGPSTMDGGYDAQRVGDLVAISFGASTYGTGAAHPNSHSRTLVWDLSTGRAVALADLFRAGSPWLEAMSAAAIADLTARNEETMAEGEWLAEGAGPDPENFASWLPRPEGVLVLFDPYQVAPYAAGPQESLVPWSALAPHLDPAGPGARLAAAAGVSLP